VRIVFVQNKMAGKKKTYGKRRKSNWFF